MLLLPLLLLLAAAGARQPATVTAPGAQPAREPGPQRGTRLATEADPGAAAETAASETETTTITVTDETTTTTVGEETTAPPTETQGSTEPPASTSGPGTDPGTEPGPSGNGTDPGWSLHDEDAAHPCARACEVGAPPLHCRYRFALAGYHTLSKACGECPARAADCARPGCAPADGCWRPLAAVNRRVPGPAVLVCRGDLVTVDLVNAMAAESTTVHWHGHHQRGTPYMDGVPLVTQCPVPPGAAFRYQFRADVPGTHFWHSHSGHQRADGAFGALVVRQPAPAERHRALYDEDRPEHTLQLLDWGPAPASDAFLAHHHAGGPNKPRTLLVNGRGRVSGCGGGGGPAVPAPEFAVEPGRRYRFRLINAGYLNCPVQLSVDNHTLLVIASDGADIRPVAADSLVSYAGERFDFVLEANASAHAAYWMRFRGLLDCDERFFAAHQAAVLRYGGAAPGDPAGPPPSYEAARRDGHEVNSLNVGTGTAGSTVIPELDSAGPDDDSLRPEPDVRFFLGFDFYPLDNPHFHSPPYGFYNVSQRMRTYTPQFNHLSMRYLSFPMLSQRDAIPAGAFCNASSAPRACASRYCECPHVLSVPLGAVLELVLVDEGVPYEANHPFHLHGYAFRVVAMGRLGNATSVEAVRRLDEAGGIRRKLRRAPLKDTCTVPDGGYTVLRVHATNPGYWLFHCHIEFHVEVGMALVLKVGEHADMAAVPGGFPRCGDWLPADPVRGEPAPAPAAAPAPAPALLSLLAAALALSHSRGA